MHQRDSNPADADAHALIVALLVSDKYEGDDDVYQALTLERVRRLEEDGRWPAPPN